MEVEAIFDKDKTPAHGTITIAANEKRRTERPESCYLRSPQRLCGRRQRLRPADADHQEREAFVNAIILTEEMKAAIALLEDERERFIWISGRAGTGKSTFLQYLKTEVRPRNAVYLAPTAVAALTIGGQTIHSFFWLDPGEKAYLETRLDPDREGRLYPLLARVETIVIDEISMVRADLLDEMDRRMRRAKGKARLPFGGARLVLFGDPYQLPPIAPDAYTPAGELFEERYKSSFFFSSQILRTRARKIRRVEFTRVFRQNEADFLATLDRCRSGLLTEADLDLLQARVLPEGKKPPADYLVLTATNGEARRLNGYRLDALPGPARAYAAIAGGRFASATDDEELPAPRELALKAGARVMFTVNDPGRRWFNGSLATVASLEDGCVVLSDEGGEFRVEPHAWSRVRFALRAGALSEETSDEYRQYPFVLGWAITIHRAQGRTLEKVFVDLSRGAFAAGQAYVAISRVTRLEGLLLRARPRIRDFLVHERVTAFLEYIEKGGAAAGPERR
jgi:ATP-dependent exoDNAse (exonuclease V) alpha subunit